MGILDIFKRRTANDAVSGAYVFPFGRSASGKAVNAKSAIQVTGVYACVRVISETVASLPLHVYVRDGEGYKKAVDHRLYSVLHNEPNSEMTSFILREVMLAHLLLWGNSYCQILRDGNMRVAGLYPLLPDRMTVDRDERGVLTYTYQPTKGGVVALNPNDVLHIPGLGFDGIMGYSPIALARNAVGLALSAEEYGGKVYANGATPSGILTHPGTVKNPKAIREAWQSTYGGSGNSGKVAVLEEGMTFHPISMSNADAQFIETRQFQLEEICRIFRVPPHMVGDLRHATFSNIEHQALEFAQYTIAPWLKRIEQAMDRSLFTESEKKKYYVEFNMDGLMRGDYKSRMEGYAIARQNGWMSANEIRALESLNPIPAEEGGDDYLINSAMMGIRQAATLGNDISPDNGIGGEN